VNSIDWGCVCPDNQANSPYSAADYPGNRHPNCHPAGTMVTTTRGEIPIEQINPGDMVLSHDGTVNMVRTKWAQRYSGVMIKIESDDRELVATPEHPILTSEGWVSSKLLQLGGNISGVFVGAEDRLMIESEPKNGPANRSKEGGFFRILTGLSSEGMPFTAVDFNGQLYIRESKVDVESPDSHVWDGPFPDGFERSVHDALILRPERAFIELGDVITVFVRLGSTPDGVMCGSNIGHSPILVRSPMAIGNGREGEPQGDETLIDDTSGDIKSLGYLVHREIQFNVKPSQFSRVKVNSEVHSPIVSVSSSKFNGLVYNMTVDRTNSYVANGFSSHNCFCFPRVRLKNGTDFRNDLRAWANGGADADLDAWYKSTYLPALF
jgi:hypothetical protein